MKKKILKQSGLKIITICIIRLDQETQLIISCIMKYGWFDCILCKTFYLFVRVCKCLQLFYYQSYRLKPYSISIQNFIVCYVVVLLSPIEKSLLKIIKLFFLEGRVEPNFVQCSTIILCFGQYFPHIYQFTPYLTTCKRKVCSIRYLLPIYVKNPV